MRIDIVGTNAIVAGKSCSHSKSMGCSSIDSHCLAFALDAGDALLCLANFFELGPVDQVRRNVHHFAVLNGFSLWFINLEMGFILAEGIPTTLGAGNVRVRRFHVLGDARFSSHEC